MYDDRTLAGLRRGALTAPEVDLVNLERQFPNKVPTSMRKVLTLSLLLLAACSEQSPQQTVEQAAPAPAPEAREPETRVDFKATALRNPLPEGIEFPFPFHRLNDNTISAGTSNPERRVYVEIRQLTPQEAEEAFAGLLAEKGFSESGTELVKGVRELTFSRTDGTKVTVKINPRHRKPRAPDATGTLHLVWQSN
ncbi:hypothetical protein FZO89_13195 [Luteimonas viscosa]|uniref:Uncharacterized protein n=1 Tax=Luteimonas viscosa TaxID=1132694 RepID=A0A5D4XR21_9GAMM|nr:hypothetical protein [Luteimonas viscosa]TYT27137.1 hypothetical protein FZO89_13195 [Luteimonas viscosa]